MVYGSQTRIGHFLTAVAQSFVQTRLEILLFFLIIIAFLLIFCIYVVVQKRIVHRKLALHSREMLEHLLVKLDLDDHETALLGRLAQHLEAGESEYSVLINHRIFDACARKMRQSEDVPEMHLDALRQKIGFRISQPEEVPASSSELPQGSSVLLVPGSGARVRGVIIGQGPGVMLVKLDPGASRLTKGMRLMLYFHNSAGIYSFNTKITDFMDDAVHLEHSSQIMHHQRRRFYRRKESLPVFVTAASAAAVPQESSLVDLGGGGASLENPGRMLKKGDFLEVSFSPEKGKVTLAARVLRLSKNGKVINVEFVSVSEAERNRIMGFLFAQSERQSPRFRN